MKTKITAILLLLSICSFSQKVNNRKIYTDIIGEVKFISIQKFNFIEKSGLLVDSVMEYKYTFKFDETGNMVEQINYNSNDVLDYHYICKYNNGKLIHEYWFKTETNLEMQNDYKYNDIGEIEEMRTNLFDGRTFKNVFYYDKRGNLVESQNIDKNGIVTFTQYYKFDTSKNVIEYKKHHINNQFYSKATYKYDKKGNLIEENHFNSNDSIALKYIYKINSKFQKIEEKCLESNDSIIILESHKYDKEGNEIELISFNNDGSLYSKKKFYYDKYKNRIETNNFDSKGILMFKETLKFDNNRNLLELKIYNGEKTEPIEYSYKYEYDKLENLIKTTIYIANTPFSIIERIIEYYP